MNPRLLPAALRLPMATLSADALPPLLFAGHAINLMEAAVPYKFGSSFELRGYFPFQHRISTIQLNQRLAGRVSKVVAIMLLAFSSS